MSLNFGDNTIHTENGRVIITPSIFYFNKIHNLTI